MSLFELGIMISLYICANIFLSIMILIASVVIKLSLSVYPGGSLMNL
ncbi:hypothetical protein HanPI659440_Chr05g0185581 [Helianthus annuus]|nr:hypothetical protein HanPI659440_Chr05g0185581 [Helianthus annuus]